MLNIYNVLNILFRQKKSNVTVNNYSLYVRGYTFSSFSVHNPVPVLVIVPVLGDANAFVVVDELRPCSGQLL